MNFWIFAVILLAIPAAIISWPLISGSARERAAGMLLLLAIPMAGLVLYQLIGTPDALNQPVVKAQQQAANQQGHATEAGSMDEMVADLQQRMSENPDDAEGWLILGRTLKTMQRYPEAENALANANRLVPDNPLIMVELAEASLFASGKPEISPQMTQLIEAALAIDPQQQKGLWLLGMAAAQNGDEARAIKLWQQLLAQLDPASGGAQTVTQQIEMAQARLSESVTSESVTSESVTSESETGESETGVGIPVTITLADELTGALPPSAALFVFIHPAGGAGMPLAVKRLAAQNFPLSLHFTDADLLRPGTSLSDFPQLDITARISMTGIANIASGDYQANKVQFNSEAAQAIALDIAQRVP